MPAKSPHLDSPARRRIIAGARRHFFDHGFRSVTMDDLAEALGMSKRTLYACFSSKADLLKAVINDKFDEANAELTRVTENIPSNDFPAALRDLLAVVHKNQSEIKASFFRDLQREDPELYALIEARRRALIERHWGQLIEKGQKTGFIRDDIPVKLINEIIHGAARAISASPVLEELDITFRSAGAALITIVLEGVLTARGREKL